MCDQVDSRWRRSKRNTAALPNVYTRPQWSLQHKLRGSRRPQQQQQQQPPQGTCRRDRPGSSRDSPLRRLSFFPKASAKGSSSNCVAHTTQHNTTQHHTTARHTPARPTTAPHTTARHTPTTAPHTTARHTPQQDATPPDRLIVFLLYS